MLGSLSDLPHEPKEAKPLPKKGAVCVQWVRCGKPTCRCARGELHGPYFYHFERVHGRLRKRYIRPADLAAVRAACDEQREKAKRWRRVRRAAQLQYRDLLPLLKEIERYGRP